MIRQSMRIAKRPSAAATTAVAVAVAAISVAHIVPALRAFAAPAARCGAAAQHVITEAYEVAARRIYADELASSEVTADRGHVTGATDLASAVAHDDAAAALAAATRIVYTHHWHIVRLRVLSSDGRLLADVGGPFVLAPVRGQITYHSAVVGRFVMSVQDDLGYEKLVTRFTGLPIELYRNGSPLMGRDFPRREVPPHLPLQGTPIRVNGVLSVPVAYSLHAFPAGTIDVTLAIPRASAALEATACLGVRARTYAGIAVHIAALLNLRTAATAFMTLEGGLDAGNLIFVRQGQTQLASSDDRPGPPSIPLSGRLDYARRSWLVRSFLAAGSVRVYLLFPVGPATGRG
jgi:hypothetical protein